MRALNPFSADSGSLLANYTRRLADTMAHKRAERVAKAAHQEGELLLKSRSQFLANMNHELRTPLNAVIGFATMLKEADAYNLGSDQRRAYAEYVLQSADLLLGHINTILEIAAIEGGDLNITNAAVDLRELVRKALERIKIRAGAATVIIVDKSSEKEVYAWCDAERVAQALDHILQTAVSSSKANGQVLVRAIYNEEGQSEITVRDKGEGFSTEEAKLALGALERVHRGLDQSFAKSGAGLAIAKKFLELQDGRLVLKTRKGQGTLARLILRPNSTAGERLEVIPPGAVKNSTTV